ncbi:hypothetical protein ACLB2K_005196 [Fragaria x ananassa]
MCERGPFPFVNRALVLDLPGDHNKKIMFAYYHGRWTLGVYIMFLDENRESITRIVDLELPMLPEEFDFACICHILHIGGQKACLVAPEMSRPEGQAPDSDEVGSHKTRGVAIPFQFEVDTTKIDKDVRNCLSLQFMHTRIFEFYTNASTFPDPEADAWCCLHRNDPGCLVGEHTHRLAPPPPPPPPPEAAASLTPLSAAACKFLEPSTAPAEEAAATSDFALPSLCVQPKTLPPGDT